MRGRRDARRAVDLDARRSRRATTCASPGVEAHPDPDVAAVPGVRGERPLRGDRGADGPGRGRERREVRVALEAERRRRPRRRPRPRPASGACSRARRVGRVADVGEQARRALDVGEQEGDDALGQRPRHAGSRLGGRGSSSPRSRPRPARSGRRRRWAAPRPRPRSGRGPRAPWRPLASGRVATSNAVLHDAGEAGARGRLDPAGQALEPRGAARSPSADRDRGEVVEPERHAGDVARRHEQPQARRRAARARRRVSPSLSRDSPSWCSDHASWVRSPSRRYRARAASNAGAAAALSSREVVLDADAPEHVRLAVLVAQLAVDREGLVEQRVGPRAARPAAAPAQDAHREAEREVVGRRSRSRARRRSRARSPAPPRSPRGRRRPRRASRRSRP